MTAQQADNGHAAGTAASQHSGSGRDSSIGRDSGTGRDSGVGQDSGTGRTPVVGAALLDSALEPTALLAAQRAYPQELRGLWEFPGGKQEPGETPEEALERECREELDLRVRILEEVPAPSPEGWSLGERFVMRVFTVVADPELDPEALAERVRAGDDHLEVRWLPLAEPGEVLGLPWISADLPIVAALLELLRTRHP